VVHGTEHEVFVECRLRCALGLGPSFDVLRAVFA
jgi:hypothetical protein